MHGFENIVTDEEIAHYEQFLHLSQCYQKLSAAHASKCENAFARQKCVCRWEEVNNLSINTPEWKWRNAHF